MQGKTHLTVGLAAGLAAGLALGESDPLTLAACAGVGGLAGLVPDWLQINLPGVKQIKGMFGHRGFSHWLWTPVLIILLLQNVQNAQKGPILAFLAGWVSHILLDAFSNGVPAFWPFGRLKLGHIKTGSKLDTFIGAAGIVAIVTILQSLV
jgi:inner membrane protein